MLIVYAFRYALVRKTAACSDISSLICQHWDDIDTFSKTLIVKEIKEAILYNKVRPDRFGPQCNEEEWSKVIKKFEEEI